MTIVNSANEPVVYGCEVSRHFGEPVMGRGEPAHLYAEVTFKTIDHGDWLEIAPGSTPKYTERWIQIPSEIDGKPVRVVPAAGTRIVSEPLKRAFPQASQARRRTDTT